MSSNKIGFLTALGIYAPIILGLALLDFRVNLVGEMGESKAFSIKLENIAGDLAEVQQVRKKKTKNLPKKTKVVHNSNHSEKIQPLESKPESSVDSNSNDSQESKGGIASNAQIAMGENDPYFLAITRIINKYHAREPVKNLYGVVGVAFSVNIEGEMEHLRVTSSSGSEKLDNVALRTIRRAARNFPPPNRTYHIKTRLVYKRS